MVPDIRRDRCQQPQEHAGSVCYQQELQGLQWVAWGKCELALAIAQGSRRQVRSSWLLLPLSCFRLCFSVWLFLAMLTGVRSQLQFEIVLSVQREQNAGPAGLPFQRCVLLLNSFLPSAH